VPITNYTADGLNRDTTLAANSGCDLNGNLIVADSDDAAMSFRDHAAIYSGLIPPPCVALFDGLVLG